MSTTEISPKEYELLGRKLVSIYETGYINPKKMYFQTFLRGVIGGLGGVIGATIVVGLLLWTVSFFENVPLIGRFTDKIRSSIDSTTAP